VDFNYEGGQTGINLDHPTVHAPVSGTVEMPPNGGQYGTIGIRDDQGNLHQFLHTETQLVQDGQNVRVGTPLGTMGGRGPKGSGQYSQHVHYQLKNADGKNINPQQWWNNSANSPWFTFETPRESGFRVYAFKGFEEIHKPYEFEIELVHEFASLDLNKLLGQTACLDIADKSGGVRHVHGVIRRFEQLHTSNYRTHYRCHLVPRLWFLGQVTDHRIFQNLSVPQIIEQILKEQNFTGDSYAFKCFFDYAPREYCVQYGETSLHFISRLCEEEGIYFYFEHERDRHVLCFSDREGGPRIAGESELRFHPGAGTQTDTATVRTLAFHQVIGSDAVTFREWNFEKTRLDLQVQQAETDAFKAPVPAGMTLERYGYPHLYQLQKDGKRYAGIEMLRHMSMSRYMEAGTDVSRMVPGFTFELFGHDRAELNARWWLVRVEQQGEQPQVLEHEAPDRGMTYAATVLAIPDTTRFVPPSAHPKNRIVGTQTAIVTGPDGEEIFPDQYGRVKVQFHWDRLGRRDENTTCWMRVSQAWAGGQFGTMAIPRIGHEVAVTFLEGDPDRPIITGRVYNSANPVPYPLPEHKTRTVFKSLSSPGGGGFNELRVEDKKGQEEIYAHAEKDVNVYVKNDWKEHILHDQHRTVDNFSYSLIKGEDQQTVNRDRKIELLSDDHLTVKGCSHSRYGDKWLLHAGNEVHIKAGRTAVIEAGTELTVKGAGSFIRLDPSGVTIMGSKVRINSGGSPGSGTGARPLLPVDSELVDEGAVPKAQINSFIQTQHLPFCQICWKNNQHDGKQQTPKNSYMYYYEIDQKFHMAEYANICTEGSGIFHPGASFSISGIIRIESQTPPTLLISCVGRTAISNIADSVTFIAEASLKKQGTLIEKKGLVPSPHGYIRPYPDSSYIIGEATFTLPEPSDETSLTLDLSGSYIAKFGTGTDVPSIRFAGVPHVTANKTFEITVKRK
jgi:type VI secretion system secreted protein VgrG